MGPYTGILLWIPQEAVGIDQVNIQKTLDNGFAFRPLSYTLRDTLDWSSLRPGKYEWRNELKSNRELALLKD